MVDYKDLFGKQEELVPELKAFMAVHPTLGVVIQHPLVFSVPHNDFMNAVLNEQFRRKNEALQKAVAESQWGTALVLHERPFRWAALDAFADGMTLKELVREFFWVWIDSENIHQNEDEIRRILGKIPASEMLAGLESADLDVYRLLPPEITIFRGCTELNRKGMSWSISKKVATKFGGRFSDEFELLEARVPKTAVLFYTNQRSEEEVVLKMDFEPRLVNVTKINRRSK